MGQLIKSILLSIVLMSGLNLHAQSAGKTYAFILNGGVSKENNYYRYYDNTVKLHKAYQDAGVKKENIITLFGSGNSQEMDTRTKMGGILTYDPSLPNQYFNGAAALKKNQGITVTGPAKKKNIREAFLKLSKQVKAGDNINMFITDHGNEENEINLWGETLTIDELKSYLALIPKTVNIQIANNICYGGKLVDLTESNVCVVSAVDDKHPGGGNYNDSPFVAGYASRIGSGSFAETFDHARFNDSPVGRVTKPIFGKDGKVTRGDMIYNIGATDSLKQFISQSKKPASNFQCDYKDSNIKNMNLLENSLLSSAAVEKKSELVESLKTAEALQKSYKTKLDQHNRNRDYETGLRRIINERAELKRKIRANKQAFAKDGEKQLSEADRAFMMAQQELLYKDGMIRKRESDQAKEIVSLKKEIEFLETADKEQFKKYNQIKSCMDRKI